MTCGTAHNQLDQSFAVVAEPVVRMSGRIAAEQPSLVQPRAVARDKALMALDSLRDLVNRAVRMALNYQRNLKPGRVGKCPGPTRSRLDLAADHADEFNASDCISPELSLSDHTVAS